MTHIGPVVTPVAHVHFVIVVADDGQAAVVADVGRVGV